MSKPVIRVEGVSKQYRLGKIGTGTLTHDLNRWWHLVRGKEDPYLKIGETNDRTRKGESQYVWSLKDVSFEINQGDAVGIIGRNGAGKSTLLKILSRTTSPTMGSIGIKGRVASLLEVGTGFHPELSGRENIFLNGAILGMTKNEIKRQFDEIVAFSGVERYIDTPVKRYSSGMYVRLAFAVAAHLQSDILIVDEVLAVGDAEFQKRCLTKMGEVSAGEGRTVLFVSHNMGSINALCNKGLYLINGGLDFGGDIESAISRYMTSSNTNATNFIYCPEPDRLAKHDLIIDRASLIVNEQPAASAVFDIFDQIDMVVEYSCKSNVRNYGFSIKIKSKGEILASAFDFTNNLELLETRTVGRHKLTFRFPKILKAGNYVIDIFVVEIGASLKYKLEDVLSFELDVLSVNPRFNQYSVNREGKFLFIPEVTDLIIDT